MVKRFCLSRNVGYATAFTIPLPLFPRIIDWYTKVSRVRCDKPTHLTRYGLSSESPRIQMASYLEHSLSCPEREAFYTRQPQTLKNGMLCFWVD